MMESEADHLSVWESDQGDRKSMIVQMSHGHTVPLHCVQVPAAPALTSRDELALLYQDRTVPPKAPTVLPGSLLSSVGVAPGPTPPIQPLVCMPTSHWGPRQTQRDCLGPLETCLLHPGVFILPLLLQ